MPVIDPVTGQPVTLVGAPGQDGQSAYQAWLAAGNTGSEAEWRASLKGQDGADGRDGQPGAGTIISRVAGTFIPASTSVVDVDGTTCIPADPTNDDHYGHVIGIVATAVSVGQTVTFTAASAQPNATATIATFGPVTGASGDWTDSGAVLYISDGTGSVHKGGLTTTRPASPSWYQQVAVSLTADAISYSLASPPIDQDPGVPPVTNEGTFATPGTGPNNYAVGNDARITGAAQASLIGTYPYTVPNSLNAIPAYLRYQGAKLNIENYLKASDPTTHFAGFVQAIARLNDAGGGSLKLIDAEFVINDVMQTDLVDGSGGVTRKGFCLLFKEDRSYEILCHRDTRIKAAANIRPASGTAKIATSGSLIGFYRDGLSQGANRSGRRRLYWRDGILDVSLCAAPAAGSPGVDGISISGDWEEAVVQGLHVEHGVTTPSLYTVDGATFSTSGSGGGDSGFFISNVRKTLLEGCSAYGSPDLGIYVSGSGVEVVRITGFRAWRCSGLIAGKRNARRIEVIDISADECGNGLYGGETSDFPHGQTPEWLIRGGKITKCQMDAVRLPQGQYCLVDGLEIIDFGRLLADPTIPYTRSISNRVTAIKLPGNRGTSVVNSTIGFRDWVPDLTGGRQASGIDLMLYNGPSGAISTTRCVFDNNSFFGKDSGNPLWTDYSMSLTAPVPSDNVLDRVGTRNNVLRTNLAVGTRTRWRARPVSESGAVGDNAATVAATQVTLSAGSGNFGSYTVNGQITHEDREILISLVVRISNTGGASGNFAINVPGDCVAYTGPDALPTYPLTVRVEGVTAPATPATFLASIEAGTNQIKLFAYGSGTGTQQIGVSALLPSGVSTSVITITGRYAFAQA